MSSPSSPPGRSSRRACPSTPSRRSARPPTRTGLPAERMGTEAATPPCPVPPSAPRPLARVVAGGGAAGLALGDGGAQPVAAQALAGEPGGQHQRAPARIAAGDGLGIGLVGEAIPVQLI